MKLAPQLSSLKIPSTFLKVYFIPINICTDHICMCPYCNHDKCNLLELKNFLSTYNMEEKLRGDTNDNSLENNNLSSQNQISRDEKAEDG